MSDPSLTSLMGDHLDDNLAEWLGAAPPEDIIMVVQAILPNLSPVGVNSVYSIISKDDDRTEMLETFADVRLNYKRQPNPSVEITNGD